VDVFMSGSCPNFKPRDNRSQAGRLRSTLN
jgi:hypothetical protein